MLPQNHYCLFKDGNAWCAVRQDFINLAESPSGFGDTADEAIAVLDIEEKTIVETSVNKLEKHQ